MKCLSKITQLALLFVSLASMSLLANAANFVKKNSGQYVYAITNSASGNSVAGYRVQDDGTLAPLPGSPFPTGGLGQGLTLLVNTDNGIVASEDNRFLFVPNRGTNDISVFRIRRNGSLVSVKGSPFPTGGVTPSSLAISGNTLFVAHTGLGLLASCPDCDYRGFHVSRGGQLTPIDDAVIELSETPASGPFSIDFTPDGQFLVGTEIISGNINVFKIEQGKGSDNYYDYGYGRKLKITPAPGSPFQGNGALPIGFLFNPANPSQLFVTNVGAGAEDGSVSSYLFSTTTGQLAPITSPAASGQGATCWLVVTQDGKHLLTTDTTSDSVSRFEIADDGQVTLLESVGVPRNGVPEETLIAPIDMVLTSNDEYLYVLLRDTASVLGYKLGENAEITPLGSVSLGAADAFPFGMVSVDLNNRRFGKGLRD